VTENMNERQDDARGGLLILRIYFDIALASANGYDPRNNARKSRFLARPSLESSEERR
jgi:hypothetical protein